MSEIQSISQQNYILHNIDAKKLYVQEPLFTANSGDAVYVGWRPDETVLWSGARNVTSITLNEAATNFETLKFTVTDPDNSFKQINEIPSDSTTNYLYMLQSNTTGSQIFRSIKINTSDYLTYTMSQEQRTQFSSNNTINWAVNYGAGVTKVIGVNRKENA